MPHVTTETNSLYVSWSDFGELLLGKNAIEISIVLFFPSSCLQLRQYLLRQAMPDSSVGAGGDARIFLGESDRS